MRVYRNVISVLFFAISVYVLILNIFSTCFTSANRFEFNYYCGDIFILNILAIAAAVAGAIFIKIDAVSKFANKYYIPLKAIMLTLIAVTGVIFVFGGGLGLGADQLDIQRSVEALRQGNTGYYERGEYMECFPNQYGYTLVSYLFNIIFGSFSITAMRLLNVLCLVSVYNDISLIGKYSGLGKTGQILVLLTGVFFIPATLHVFFLYGNLLGLALALMSVRLVLKAFKKDKLVYGLIACAVMLIGCMIKSNDMIFAIGIIIYCFFKAVSTKKYKHLIIIPILVIAVAVSSTIPVLIMRKVTGMPLDGGASLYSFMVMGFQENNPGYAGGYNGFNIESYQALGGDKAAQTEYSKEVLKESILELVSEPYYFLNFFTRKQLHQWADPAYKSYWSVQAVPQQTTAQWFYELIRPDHAYPVIIALSFFQLIVWTGAVFYIWFGRKEKRSAESLVIPLIVFGGFLFHTIWEAKSQYTFPYFMLLFPISILGWRMFKEWYLTRDKTPIKKKLHKLANSRINWSFSFTLAAGATLLVFGEVVGLGTMTEQFKYDNQRYKEYITHDYREFWNPLDDGTYILKNGDKEISCELINVGDRTLIKQTDGDLYLTLQMPSPDTFVFAWAEKTDLSMQSYKFYMENDELAIVFKDDFVLWCSGDNVSYRYYPYGNLLVSHLDNEMTWTYTRVS